MNKDLIGTWHIYENEDTIEGYFKFHRGNGSKFMARRA